MNRNAFSGHRCESLKRASSSRDKSGSHIWIIIVLSGRESAQHMILAQTHFVSANHACWFYALKEQNELINQLINFSWLLLMINNKLIRWLIMLWEQMPMTPAVENHFGLVTFNHKIKSMKKTHLSLTFSNKSICVTHPIHRRLFEWRESKGPYISTGQESENVCRTHTSTAVQ